MNAVKGQISEP